MSDQPPPFPPTPPAAPPPPPGGPFAAPPAAAPLPPPPPSPASTDGRRWKTWQLAVSAGVSLLLGIGLGAASPGEDESGTVASDGPSRTTVDREEARDQPAGTTEPRRTTTTRPPTTTTTTTTPPEQGTRENPFALGTPLVSDSGVEIVVNSVDFNAAGAIAAENMFNDPAPAGMRYALVNITITNTGDEPIDTGFEIRVSMIGSANRLYDFSNGYCSAVIPNSLSDGGQLFTGGTFTGNDCLMVPEAEVADGSLLVGIAAGFGDPVFVRSA